MPRLSRNRLNMEDGRIDRASLKDWSESALGVSNNLFSGTSYTINIENGTVYNVILNANCVFSFANPTGSGNACSFTLVLKQDNVGNRSVTFPTIYWPGGVQPTLASAPGDFDVIEFSTLDGGAKWFGNVVPRTIRGTELWTWGSNFAGQLGVNITGTTQRSSPVQVGVLTNWSKVSTGYYHVIGTKTDGTLWAWGANNNGQLGINLGTAISRSSPVQVGTLTNWKTFSAGYYHNMAIKTDGTLWTWGIGTDGRPGLNGTTNRSSPVQVGTLSDWVFISTRGNKNLAIKTDGTLWAWGSGASGQLGLNDAFSRSSPVQVGTLTDWRYASAGSGVSSAAIKTDGTLWTWGANNVGQLGNNLGAVSRSSPAQVGTDTNWAFVSTSSQKTAAIRNDGTLWAWGSGASGRLGLNNTTSFSSPVQVGTDNNWCGIDFQRYNSIAIKINGTIWAWGQNSSAGQLGTNDTIDRSSPTQIGTFSNWSSVNHGRNFGAGLQTP